MRIRLGIVGLGNGWERRYKPALLRMSDKYEIRAVFDEVSYRASLQATELECDATDSFTCLIERDDVDAVYVLGGSWLGLAPVRVACRVRKPVFLGRPIAPPAPDADDIFQAVQASGIPFMVEFPWRFYPASIRLMELLASGLGSPLLAFCEQHVLEPEKATLTRVETDYNEIALHLADWLRFMFGKDPVTIRAIRNTLSVGPSRGFETLVAEFGEGRVGHATIRRFVQPLWTEAAEFRRAPSFQVIAEHGVAFLEMPGELTWFDHSGRHDETHELDRPLGGMLSDRFYRIVRHGLVPSPGLADAIWARQMILQAREQARES